VAEGKAKYSTHGAWMPAVPLYNEFPIDPTCVQEHKGNEAVFRANECPKGCYMFLTVPSGISTGALTERQASTIKFFVQVEYLVLE